MALAVLRSPAQLKGAAVPEHQGPLGWKTSSWFQFQACAHLLEIEFRSHLSKCPPVEKGLNIKNQVHGRQA